MARELLRDVPAHPTLYTLRSACALALLADHWKAQRLTPKICAVIGDGGGFFGALLRRYLPGIRLYCIDLPKALVFQARLHELADPTVTMSLLPGEGVKGPSIVFVLPQDIEKITDTIDCAANMASMQEMTQASVNSYFAFLRRRVTPASRFYCVNRARKELPGGEVSAFAEYPWHEDDEILVDGPCPYYTHYFSPYTVANGPRLFGVRLPYVNYFDGVLLHRLARLAPEA